MTKPVVPTLHTPEQIADVLGCSAWWVREQARRRRIPFTKPGGKYRFTDEHLLEIIRIFEENPVHQHTPTPAAASSTRGSEASRPVVKLRARRPRRARLPAESAPATGTRKGRDRGASA